MINPGNEINEDIGIWSVQRRIKLTRQISYLGCAVSLLYIIFDILSNTYIYLPYYLILITGSLLSLLLLKYNKVTLAKIILLVSGTLLLGILASWESSETGLFMYFLVIGVTAFTIFGTEEKFSAIAIGLFSLTVFYIVYFTDLIQFEKADLTQEYISTSFFINFCICLFALMTVMYHIMSLSINYERSMLATQREMMQLTNELKESQSRFELAIKGSSVGIWDWDIVNDSLFISPLLVELFNYPPEKYIDMKSEKIDKVAHPDDLPILRKALNYHLKERKPFTVECRLRKGDGTYFWTIISGQAEWNRQGRAVRMVGTIVEIDDLKKAFKQLEIQNELLEKTNEELDRFVYSTSHDLRAPLSSIQGLVNVAVHSGDSEEVIECLKMINKRVHALNGFIAEIIDYSRNSRLEVITEPFSLKLLVSEVIEGLQFFDKSEDVQFQLEIDDEFLIDSDRGRLKIILNNLIVNAIKYHDYTKPNPYVKIKSDIENNQVIIVIEDNGSGIEEEYQDKIFNMFFRASEVSEGSGLGLYITKEMVDKLKGTIRMESEIQKGTTFYIDLPINKSIAKQVTA